MIMPITKQRNSGHSRKTYTN